MWHLHGVKSVNQKPRRPFRGFLNLSKFLLSTLKRAPKYTNGMVNVGGFFLVFFLALDFEESLENDFAVSRNVWNWMAGCIKGPSLVAVLLCLGLWLVRTPQI